ncbi:MAG: hypothetical protein KJ811_02435, partial [Candidatus Margulisbacteria bacterium]|nr:hypothetical protein [Candidatus Margulisiibacteriota bacterium]
MSITSINNNQGLQEQAVAGNASIILNSLDKELNKASWQTTTKTKKFDLEGLDNSRKMIAKACTVTQVIKEEEKKEQHREEERRQKRKEYKSFKLYRHRGSSAYAWKKNPKQNRRQVLRRQRPLRRAMCCGNARRYVVRRTVQGEGAEHADQGRAKVFRDVRRVPRVKRFGPLAAGLALLR